MTAHKRATGTPDAFDMTMVQRHEEQLAAIATALRQYGVFIDALRDALGLSDAEWEAAVNRAIDRVEFTQKE